MAKPTRGYSATKDQLLKRLSRAEGQVRGLIGEGETSGRPSAQTAELMGAVGQLMRR